MTEETKDTTTEEVVETVEETKEDRTYSIDLRAKLVDRNLNPIYLKQGDVVTDRQLAVANEFSTIIEQFDDSFFFETIHGEELEAFFKKCLDIAYDREDVDDSVTELSETLYVRLIRFGMQNKILTWDMAYQIKNLFKEV